MHKQSFSVVRVLPGSVGEENSVMDRIPGSVGRGGRNRREDVITVQRLINANLPTPHYSRG